MNKPKISIVTVVWNDAKGLEKTIKSVIEQRYENIEFIVIDGGSNDGTVEVIKQYEDQIDYWVSENDKGIYDAMNKGIKVSTGSWINFMNAGDTFYTNKVLSQLDLYVCLNKTLVYGNQIVKNQINLPQPEEILKIGGTFACHQSMFFNKKLLKDDLIYNLKFKIFGDYELVNRIYLKYPNSFQYANINVANFEGGGISSKITKEKRIEKYSLLYKYYGLSGVFGAILHRVRRLL